jgi:hypothetical protein
MLLNEFLKEHHKVERLETTVAQQQKNFNAAIAEIEGANPESERATVRRLRVMLSINPSAYASAIFADSELNGP